MIDSYEFTQHALARLCDMAITPDEIVTALDKPEWVERSKKYPDCDLFQSGRLTLSVARQPGLDGRRAVVTALWRYAEDWEADYQYEPPEGREPRPVDHLRRRPTFGPSASNC